MTEEQTFIAAIAKDPKDKTARLVYADYVQERGNEPYAEFIRRGNHIAKARHNYTSGWSWVRPFQYTGAIPLTTGDYFPTPADKKVVTRMLNNEAKARMFRYEIVNGMLEYLWFNHPQNVTAYLPKIIERHPIVRVGFRTLVPLTERSFWGGLRFTKQTLEYYGIHRKDVQRVVLNMDHSAPLSANKTLAQTILRVAREDVFGPDVF